MKKSNQIILTTVLYAAISSCNHKVNDVLVSDSNNRTLDTTLRKIHFRYSGSGWHLLFAGKQHTQSYQPRTKMPRVRSVNELRTSGGFGSSAHTSHRTSGG